MRHYMIIDRDRGVAKVVQNPSFDGEWERTLLPEGKDVEAHRIDGATGDGDPRGLFYNGELAGPDGMSYLLFAEPGTTEAEYLAACAWLRNQFDVVRIWKVQIREWAQVREAVA